RPTAAIGCCHVARAAPRLELHSGAAEACPPPGILRGSGARVTRTGGIADTVRPPARPTELTCTIAIEGTAFAALVPPRAVREGLRLVRFNPTWIVPYTSAAVRRGVSDGHASPLPAVVCGLASWFPCGP